MYLVIVTATLACVFIATWWHVSWRVYKYSPEETLPVHDIDITVSVIICARNEEDHIAECIASIVPQLSKIDELIIVDDHSTDRTCEIIDAMSMPQVKLISLPSTLSGKKAAVAQAISHARHEIILQTDADCRVSSRWIERWKAIVTNERHVLHFGTVQLAATRNLLEIYQSMDLYSLMKIQSYVVDTWQVPLGNAANCAIDLRETIGSSSVDGRAIYTGYIADNHGSQQRSGDDIFFAEYVLRSGGTLGYHASSSLAVTTAPEISWKALLGQRMRWAEKSHAYRSWKLQLLSYGVAGYYLFCLLLTVTTPWYYPLGLIALALWMSLYLSNVLQMHRTHTMQEIAYYTVMHVMITVGSGSLAILGIRAAWKGRRD